MRLFAVVANLVSGDAKTAEMLNHFRAIIPRRDNVMQADIAQELLFDYGVLPVVGCLTHDKRVELRILKI